jgi:hypothetical protein
VALEATGGIDSLMDDDTADVIGDTVGLTATGGGIGAVTAIDVTAGTALSADSSAADGAIQIDSLDDLTLGAVDGGAGDVTLYAMGDIDSLSDDDTADVSGGTLTLTAEAGGIGDDSTVDVIALTALNADSSADDSDIVFDSLEDLPVGEIDAGEGDVELTSAGAIDDATDDTLTDITGTAVTMAAEDGIGGTNPLELAALDVDATTTTGDINLSNTSTTEAAVGELITDDGSVAFTQSGGGSVVFDEVLAEGGDLSLTNTVADITLADVTTTGTADITAEGSILDDGSTRTQLTAGEASLRAATGTIGLWNAPLQVGIDGTLFVAAGGQDDHGQSVTIDGIWGELVEGDDIPGDVVLNGRPQSVFDWLRIPDIFVANKIIEMQVFQEAVYIFHKEDVVIRYVDLGVSPLSDEAVEE